MIALAPVIRMGVGVGQIAGLTADKECRRGARRRSRIPHIVDPTRPRLAKTQSLFLLLPRLIACFDGAGQGEKGFHLGWQKAFDRVRAGLAQISLSRSLPDAAKMTQP